MVIANSGLLSEDYHDKTTELRNRYYPMEARDHLGVGISAAWLASLGIGRRRAVPSPHIMPLDISGNAAY